MSDERLSRLRGRDDKSIPLNAGKAPPNEPKHVAFFLNPTLNMMTPPEKAKGTFALINDGDILISCKECARLAMVAKDNPVHVQITSGLGFRCGGCNYQCHTKLMMKGVPE